MNILIETEKDGFQGHVLYEASHQELELYQQKLNLSQEKFNRLLCGQKYIIRIHFSEAKAINVKECMEELKTEFPQFIWLRIVIANGFEGDYKIEFFSSNPSSNLQEIDDFSGVFRSKIRDIILNALIIPTFGLEKSDEDECERDFDEKITRLTSILDRLDERRIQHIEVRDDSKATHEEQEMTTQEIVLPERERKERELASSLDENNTDIIQTLERAKKKTYIKKWRVNREKEILKN